MLEITNPQDQEINAKLIAKISTAVQAQSNGILNFAKYMEMALYTPELGYYCNPRYRFGAQGDFVTAPEISPLYAACIAKQCTQVLQAVPNAKILELGAGTGKMAADILLALEQQSCLPEQYCILELSAYLKEQQQQTILQHCPHLLERVQWLQHLPEPGFNGIILGNEVLDAMPIHKIYQTENSLRQAGVRWQDDKFIWDLMDLDFEPLEIQQQLPAPYETEYNLNAAAWLASLADLLQQGIILLIDYGFPEHEYYHPDRYMGTLMCHYRHKAHPDPLILVGLQDITAHVDFTDVARNAVANGLELIGYTTQAMFLLSSGITEMLDSSNQELCYQQQQAIKQLTLSSEMGELFKVIALGKNIDFSLDGFKFRDLRDRL